MNSLAKKLITEGYKKFSGLKNTIEIYNSDQAKNKNLLYETIEFKEGDTLIKILKRHLEDKKIFEIVMNNIKKILNPEKIQIGTELTLVKKNKYLLALYMQMNSENYLLAYLDKGSFKTQVIKTNQINLILENKLPSLNINKVKPVTRVDVFNNPNFIINKNTLTKGESIYELLRKYKVNNNEINNILKSIKPYFDFKKIKIGNSIGIIFHNDKFIGISYEINKHV